MDTLPASRDAAGEISDALAAVVVGGSPRPSRKVVLSGV
jgi:hypothetical protein